MAVRPAIERWLRHLLSSHLTTGLHRSIKEVASFVDSDAHIQGNTRCPGRHALARDVGGSQHEHLRDSRGNDGGRQPVSATATFVTSTNDLQITLTNLQNNPTSVIQNLSDLASH